MAPAREPVFNIPAVIVVLVAVMSAIHVVLAFILTEDQLTQALLLFAFIPARYGADLLPDGWLPGGYGAEAWSFVTYAFIHADFGHIFFNMLWLVAFGTPVARRFGALRFLIFFAVTAAAGALAHLIAHRGELLPVIGASASVSGSMAAAMRFMFQGRSALDLFREDGVEIHQRPAAPLRDLLREPRVFAFLAIWFGINLLVGVFGIGVTGVDQAVAWEAHVGGFLAGMLLFPLFDPVRSRVPARPEPERMDRYDA